MKRLAAGCLAAALALAPGSAPAQERFLEGVAALTAAVAGPDAEKPARFAAALARMAAGLDAWDQAIERFERVAMAPRVAASEEQVAARVALGRLYLERGRPGDALREFDAAAAVAPRPDIHVLRALAFDAAGDAAAARAAFRAAWLLAPAEPIAAYQVLHRQAVDAAEAERARGVLATTYQALLAGTALLAPTRFPVATHIPDSLSTAPVLADAATRGVFPLLAQQQYTAAVAELRRAVAAMPVAGDSAIDHFVRGRAHEADRRIPEARREYTAAAAGALAGRRTLYAGIGRLARVEGDFAAAIDVFTSAVRLDPNDPAAHRDLARAYLEQDRAQDAFSELVVALLIDPRDAWAHATIGQIYLDDGRHAEAVAALTRALDLKPGAHETRYALAAALARAGRAEDAARELQTFERARRDALDARRRAIASEGR